MIHLVTICTGPRSWVITTSDVRAKILAEHHKKRLLHELDQLDEVVKAVLSQQSGNPRKKPDLSNRHG